MGVAWADIMAGGMTPQAAAEKACKRIEEILRQISDQPELSPTGGERLCDELW
jgi:hypothetical protein